MQQVTQQKRIIISGGGTGGHVYPAIAIADALKRLYPEVLVHFVGAEGKMEMEKVPEAGYTIEGLWISGIERSFSARNVVFPLKLLQSLAKAYLILNRFKPHVAVGVGGYASGPLLGVAARIGIPCLLQEQNGYAGLTNKLLAKQAKRICVAYPDMGRFFPESKISLTGNPVRTDLVIDKAYTEEAHLHFGLNPEKPTVFVFSGSGGAKVVNQAIAAQAYTLLENGYQLLWATGKYYYPDYEQDFGQLAEKGLVLVPYISRMEYAYLCADLVIARAGALTISELALTKKACILVPSPNVAEDHQTKNAVALTEKKAAIMVKDTDAIEILVPTAVQLMKQADQRQELSENIATFARPEAAELIAKEIMGLIQ